MSARTHTRTHTKTTHTYTHTHTHCCRPKGSHLGPLPPTLRRTYGLHCVGLSGFRAMNACTMYKTVRGKAKPSCLCKMRKAAGPWDRKCRKRRALGQEEAKRTPGLLMGGTASGHTHTSDHTHKQTTCKQHRNTASVDECASHPYHRTQSLNKCGSCRHYYNTVLASIARRSTNIIYLSDLVPNI